MALLREKDKLYKTPEDICAHLGEDYDDYYGAVNPPIYQTTLFSTVASGHQQYVYTRVANPTTEVAERKIAALEGAEGALCFGSGMGAISAAIMHYVRPNAHVIMVATSYPDTKRFCNEYLAQKAGISLTFVKGDSLEEIQAALRPQTALIYLESPSTTVFKMQDLEAIAALAKHRGIGTVIDNTYATPLYQNPLKWGIDVSLHTVSKYLSGHSNVVGGVLCARKELIESIQNNERSLYGSVLGPQESYLLIMGLRTLPYRLKQHGENAVRVVRYLEAHPNVERVFYPGSGDGLQKTLFKKYMSGTTGLISLIPASSSEGIQQFIKRLRCFREGVSWGGFESLVSGKTVGISAQQAAQEDVLPGIVRLHIGLENVNTLIEDLDRALKDLPGI